MDNLSQMFANNQENKPEPKIQRAKLNLISTALIVTFLGLAAYGTFLFVKNSQLENRLKTAKTELTNLKESKLTENLTVSTSLKTNFLNQKQQQRIFWTNVVHNLETSVPEPDKINISSISGSENGTVNVSINTTNNSLNPFLDTANLITTLKTKPFFQNIFIPSINSTVTQGGQGQLSYTLRFNYLKNQAQETSALDPSEFANTETTEEPALPDPSVLDELRQRLNQEPNQ